jgi:hypothetical protein
MGDALFLLATAYRIVYGVAGSYVTARLAPDRPMQHALALGMLKPPLPNQKLAGSSSFCTTLPPLSWTCSSTVR